MSLVPSMNSVFNADLGPGENAGDLHPVPGQRAGAASIISPQTFLARAGNSSGHAVWPAVRSGDKTSARGKNLRFLRHLSPCGLYFLVLTLKGLVLT